MIRTKDGSHSFVAQSSLEKLIVNLENNDHGWRDTII